MQSFRVNDHDMAYVEIGKGPPLVLVHGTLGDFRTWNSVMGPLSATHRVILEPVEDGDRVKDGGGA